MPSCRLEASTALRRGILGHLVSPILLKRAMLHCGMPSSIAPRLSGVAPAASTVAGRIASACCVADARRSLRGRPSTRITSNRPGETVVPVSAARSGCASLPKPMPCGLGRAPAAASIAASLQSVDARQTVRDRGDALPHRAVQHLRAPCRRAAAAAAGRRTRPTVGQLDQRARALLQPRHALRKPPRAARRPALSPSPRELRRAPARPAPRPAARAASAR